MDPGTALLAAKAVPAIAKGSWDGLNWIKERAKYHSDLNDHKDLCDELCKVSMVITFGILCGFEQVGDDLGVSLQQSIVDFQSRIKKVVEKIRSAFPTNLGDTSTTPVKGTEGSSTGGGKLEKSPHTRLSISAVKLLEEQIKEFRDLNDIYLQLATSILFIRQVQFLGPNPQQTAQRISDDIKNSPALNSVKAFRDTALEMLADTVSVTAPRLEDIRETESRVSLHDGTVESNMWIVSDETDSSQGPKLLEKRSYPRDILQIDFVKLMQTTSNVVNILHAANPHLMAILCCEGFRHIKSKHCFELQFSIPEGFFGPPKTFKNVLQKHKNTESDPVHSLDERIHFAKRLVSSVFYIHAANFVHKNIRSDNIIMLWKTGDRKGQFPKTLGEPFLVGYDGIRKFDAESKRAAVSDEGKLIYLSPERHRLNPGDDFTMKHDMYSVGVVLLELGVMQDLTDQTKGGLGERLRKKIKEPEELKKALLKMARGFLPASMGKKYTDIVVMCLEGFDTRDDGESTADQAGDMDLTRYSYSVLDKLQEIVL